MKHNNIHLSHLNNTDFRLKTGIYFTHKYEEKKCFSELTFFQIII